MKPGIDQITEERVRQITVEGYSADRDDTYVRDELVAAGRAYAIYADEQREGGPHSAISLWPWGQESWKPSPSPVRNYVKGGALLFAEVDRLNRAGLTDRAIIVAKWVNLCAYRIDEIQKGEVHP